MKRISAWTATLQDDIDATVPLLEKYFLDYRFQVFNIEESLMIVVIWPSGGRIAFRVAFAMGKKFEVLYVQESEMSVLLRLETPLGKYSVMLEFPDEANAIFHYTTTFVSYLPVYFPFSPRDIVPLTLNGNIENTSGKIHSKQVGARSGILYASFTKPAIGSFFYFQNLTSLSDYCEATETSATETVGGEWPDIGFKLPYFSEKSLPQGKEFILNDAYVHLIPEILEDNFEIAKQFINSHAIIYPLIPKKETSYRDWISIADKGLEELSKGKGCWSHADGNSYLNAYLSDYKTPPESMVQLAVLTPLLEFAAWSKENYEIINHLKAGIPSFYDDRIHTLARWLPYLEKNLDESEEQKKPMVMDSWYLHHPLMNLSQLALKGNKEAESIFMKSIDKVIEIAHEFDYEWPVFYKIDTLEIIKAETQPGEGGEKDVPGSYAHLMLQAWDLTGKKRYFNEAVKVAKKLEELGFDLFYQANNTAFTAGAMLRLYKETKEEIYLNISYVCLASILKNIQLWSPDYGFAKHYSLFFAVYPLQDAPYTAAYEELEVYAGLFEYLREAKGLKILPALHVLLPEFIKYAIDRLPFYYPPMLPKEVISEETKTGEIDCEIWIPIEDLRDGWEKSGQIGQEVYGAGLSFVIIPRHYHKIQDEDFMLFIDYPIEDLKTYKNKSLTFHSGGDSKFHSRLVLFSEKPKSRGFQVSYNESNDKEEIMPLASTDAYLEFMIKGNSKLKITWK